MAWSFRPSRLPAGTGETGPQVLPMGPVFRVPMAVLGAVARHGQSPPSLRALILAGRILSNSHFVLGARASCPLQHCRGKPSFVAAGVGKEMTRFFAPFWLAQSRLKSGRDARAPRFSPSSGNPLFDVSIGVVDRNGLGQLGISRRNPCFSATGASPITKYSHLSALPGRK